MEVKATLIFILLIKTLVLLKNVKSDEILGCGGFIKSHADIDFSKVEVKLLTKQGSLKDKTDCSPSNGYYFLPVYDKGEYILKISPPAGWSFEPESVHLNFDGTTDACSQGKDVNFVFKGFGITGKIGILGQKIGAKGVRVELHAEIGKDIKETTSDINGVFSFTPIIPGKYVVKAIHDKWHFEKSEYVVVVNTGNTELPENSLVVSGFDVQGKVLSDGQPFGNIGLILFAAKGLKITAKCVSTNIPLIQSNNLNYGPKPLCFTTTNPETGEYFFVGVPPGKYLIRPYMKSTELKFHIDPESLEVTVVKDTVVLQEKFDVTGFSVSGRILTSPTGWGVANAKIKLNGQEVATSHTDGEYILKNIKAGTYTIQVSADNVQFKDHTVKISVSNPSLPDIIVSTFKVCGQVVSPQSHIVAIKQSGHTTHTEVTTNPGSGEWCTFLPNGKFEVEVLTSENERNNGIQFFPLTQTLQVNSSPVSGIMFSQLRATVSGEVKCLSDADNICKDITVTLNSVDSNGNFNGQYITAVLKNGKYTFSDVLPGTYDAVVPNSALCWEKHIFKLTVKSAIEMVPTFVHKGYKVTTLFSHNNGIKYKLRTNDPNITAKEIVIETDLNTFCVDRAGTYDVEFFGCHLYDQKEVSTTFSTSDTSPYTVTFMKHKNGLRILSEERTPYQMLVERGDKKEVVNLIEETEKVDGYFSYRFDFYLKNQESIKLIPTSDFMLFKPDSKEIVGASDCVNVAFNFIATKGLIIYGRIEPPIDDATITLTFPKNLELQPIVINSNKKGEFKFGPLDSSIDFHISAEKESYIFSDYDQQSNLFKAHKLCEVIATVKDEQGNRLPGVLLSLSGGKMYRKNLVTGENGAIKFHSLSPSQYYLRPMMKEYKFEPNSKMIDVEEGATVHVELSGKRVAFSVFGAITSLNGDPFPNVLVEAVSQEPCSMHQEESSSENNGHYRIRGLQPGCQYLVRLKSNVNANVDRSLPTDHLIDVAQNDVKDVNIIAISPLGFIDVAARIMASSNEHYKTLRLQMYKKGSSDSPIYSQRVESPLNMKSKINPGIMVFFPRIPFDGKIYFIELSTSLSDKNFKYDLPLVQFVANASSIFIELEFNPEVKSTDGDLNQNSISALILIGLVGFAFFKQDLVLELLTIVWNRLNVVVQEAINKNKKKETGKFDHVVDDKELEQLAQSINAVKKKKVKKIN